MGITFLSCTIICLQEKGYTSVKQWAEYLDREEGMQVQAFKRLPKILSAHVFSPSYKFSSLDTNLYSFLDFISIKHDRCFHHC